MALTVIRGITRKPAASQALVETVSSMSGAEGFLYLGYPILGSNGGRLAIDGLLVSPERGLVLFDLVEGGDPTDYQERLDDAANKLESKLRSHASLVERRSLAVSITTITFAPGLPSGREVLEGAYLLCGQPQLAAAVAGIPGSDSNLRTYPALLSALQNISTIRHSRSRRVTTNVESRGHRLKSLEDSIATLDSRQSRAVIETVEGVQRIRGLAGSGKTIVIALKAAYLHAQHPDWRIGVTFHTRSLKPQFRRFINTFCISQTGEEPDWDRIRVVNAWGAPGGEQRDGIYFEFCKAHGIPYQDYGAAKDRYGRDHEFAGACAEALQGAKEPIKLYDVLLVDEAQDLPPSFLKICYESLSDAKRLVYAYDELQNLGTESVPPPEVLFGNDSQGSPRVSLDAPAPSGARRDIILEVCYRNSRPVLSTAHALGFGIYRPAPARESTGLVQIFESPSLWTDIGYRVKSGILEPGESVVLHRTPETSPVFLESHSPLDDLITFHRFANADEQAEWLIEAICSNIEGDELRHDDIVVINPDPLKTRNAVAPIRSSLLARGINSHLAGVTTDQDVFFLPDQESITFTGIYRAKGNEAGMVYVVNADDCQGAWNLATARNQLFTAITRSKAWVRVLGVGARMDALIHEFNRVRGKNFELDFQYPTDSERRRLAIVHRDVSPETQKKIKDKSKSLVQLAEAIERGEVLLQDLDPSVVERIRGIFAGGSEA